MASTYSNLKFQLMATGENSGTWGTVTNVNLGTAIEEAIAGSADVTFSSGNVTLTLTDTNASQTARNMRLNLTGTTGGARDLIVPAIEKMYVVNNGCADAVTVKVSGQTGVAVPAGKTMILYNNATDVVDAITHLSSLTLGSALPVASGGTGITSFGTGVATALGISVGSSGAFVTNGGALGTPSSGTLSSCTVDGTDSVGFRNTPINSQSADYTLVLADSGKTMYHPASDANARTFTIPANGSVAYAVGTVISFINLSANDLTIAITSDTMYLAGDGTTGSRTLAQYGIASAVKVASTTWVISGNGLT